MNLEIINIPNLLTFSRLILSPLLVPIMFVYGLPMHSLELNILLAVLFVFLSLTDFLDGYLARKYGQETLIGRLLDPLADKFLLFSALIALVYVHRIYFYWAIILIGREFFMMGLREIAINYGISIHVSILGKIKTSLQLIFLTFVIINPHQHLGMHAPIWNGVEYLLLGFTLFFTILSACVYYQDFMNQWKNKVS